MSENFNVEQATEEARNSELNFDANGMEMVGGAVVGGSISAIVAFKLGYAAGVKESAKAMKMESRAMLEKIKAMTGAKKKGFTLFGYKFQAPLKKVEEGSKEPQEVTNVEEEETKPEPKPKKAKQPK